MLSQEQFAAAGGVKRGSQVGYESGKRSPNAEYFEAISKIGVDIQYIITGQRSLNANVAPLVQEPKGRYLTGDIDSDLLADIIQKVDEIAGRPNMSEYSAADKAKIISVVYRQYRARGLRPKKEDPAILTAFDLLAS